MQFKVAFTRGCTAGAELANGAAEIAATTRACNLGRAKGSADALDEAAEITGAGGAVLASEADASGALVLALAGASLGAADGARNCHAARLAKTATTPKPPNRAERRVEPALAAGAAPVTAAQSVWRAAGVGNAGRCDKATSRP